MSTVRRHRPVEACAAAARAACIAWEVSPEALRKAGQLLPAGTNRASIRWEIEGEEARCVLAAGTVCRALASGRASWSRDAGTGLWILIVTGERNDEHLSAVLREGGQALYARTSVLTHLGLAGGRYDAPAAQLI